jgi:hypothetical protein
MKVVPDGSGQNVRCTTSFHANTLFGGAARCCPKGYYHNAGIRIPPLFVTLNGLTQAARRIVHAAVAADTLYLNAIF